MRKCTGLSETANYGVSMTTITIVDSSWRHNENCCYANMRSQGQASCLLMLEFKCHLRYCSSQEADVSFSHSVVLHYILFQIMAWRRPGNKPLSEAILVSLLTHKCFTRPQWVNVYCVLNDIVYHRWTALWNASYREGCIVYRILLWLDHIVAPLLHCEHNITMYFTLGWLGLCQRLTHLRLGQDGRHFGRWHFQMQFH